MKGTKPAFSGVSFLTWPSGFLKLFGVSRLKVSENRDAFGYHLLAFNALSHYSVLFSSLAVGRLTVEYSPVPGETN